MVPADYEQCEGLFYREASLPLCYQAPRRQFVFSHRTLRRLPPGADLGEAELDILSYCRDAAARIADVVAGAAGGR